MTRISRKFQACLAEDGKKRDYFIVYTIVFFITALFVYSWCIAGNKSFIVQSDGFTQHLRALIYYGDYLRQIIRNLVP